MSVGSVSDNVSTVGPAVLKVERVVVLETRNSYSRSAMYVDRYQQKNLRQARFGSPAREKCHGRAINHISKIIPAALRSGRSDRVGVLLETPES